MAEQYYPIFSEAPERNRRNNYRVEKLLSIVSSYWPLFAICIIIALSGGFVYLRYATPIYATQAKVLVKDEKRGNMQDGQILQELGINSNTGNVENEIEIFNSRGLMKKAVIALGLNTRYFVPGTIKNSEIYKEAPFRLTTLFPDSLLRSSYTYDLKISDAGFTVSDNRNKWTGKWGDTIALMPGKVLFTNNSSTTSVFNNVHEYIIVFTPAEALATKYKSVLDIIASNKQSSIINLAIKDEIPARGEDVLNKLIEVYQQASIDDRNRVANGTMDFIDERLVLVSGELQGVEKDIEGFKQSNELTDLSNESRILLDNTSEFSMKLVQSEVQLSIVQSLEKYLKQNGKRVVPSTLLIEDVTLTRLIDKYNALQNQREGLLMTYTETGSIIANVNQQLDNLRSDILSNLASMKTTLGVSIAALKKRTGFLDEKIRQVPRKERIFLEYSRQQAIKQELYLFLLKKREETAISKSATISNLRVIEPAKNTGSPVSPNRTKVLLTAFVIGLIIPGVRVLLKELFNVRVTSKDDITNATAISIVAEIGRSTEKDIIVTKRESRTIVAEQFRALRTNLQFLFTEHKEKLIMITSSMSGEGKSFVALNLANTLSLSGKKVVLLELDLRKPKISQALNINNEPGFSDHVIGKASVDDIIRPSGISDNLFFVSSGSIPPNPSELIMHSRTESLLNELRERFDYIVMDTAPVGLVTDAKLLSRHSDCVLYVVRLDYTFKQQLTSVDDLYREGKMPKLSLVVNDVKMSKGSGYGYTYGYGNGYYDNENGSSDIRRAIRKLKSGI
jgi:tyrosine-protein kinase Etk/Wzc